MTDAEQAVPLAEQREKDDDWLRAAITWAEARTADREAMRVEFELES